MTEKPQDDTIKGRIIGLLQKGYGRSQLINDLSFAERTVDSAIKEYREQEGGEVDEPMKVLREAKSESKEVARVAAEEAAWRLGSQVQEVAR